MIECYLPGSDISMVIFQTMSVPFATAGNGANMAFCDAWQLAQQLTDPRHATLHQAVAAFDAESGPRSSQAVTRGSKLLELCHQQGIRYWLVRAFLGVFRILMGASSFRSLRSLLGRSRAIVSD